LPADVRRPLTAREGRRAAVVFVKHKGVSPAEGPRSGGDPAAWDAVAQTWEHGADVEARLRHQPDWALISRFIRPPARVLEAGCGFAKWVWFLERGGYEAYGIDFSEVALAKSLQRWPGLRLVLGRIQEMPFEDGFFDAIVSFGAVEHDEAGPQAMLAEMFRVLKPGGVLYCTVPCHNLLRRSGLAWLSEFYQCNRVLRRLRGQPPEVEFWQYRWLPSEYEEILRSQGFQVISVEALAPPRVWRKEMEGAGGWWRFLAWLHRRWPWLMPHMMAGICRKPRDGEPVPAVDAGGAEGENTPA